MSIYQTTLLLKPHKRVFHLITNKIEALLSNYNISTGIINIFIKHTSASLTLNENVDTSVREDMENFFNDIADDKSYVIHTYEGTDDMRGHLKNSILGQSLNIPISDGKLNLGTWQGIYFGEHRDHASKRELVITINGKANTVTSKDLVHAPFRLNTPQYQFTDLFNEGLSGILSEQSSGWYYKHNLDNGKFEQGKTLSLKPSFSGTIQSIDLYKPMRDLKLILKKSIFRK